MLNIIQTSRKQHLFLWVVCIQHTVGCDNGVVLVIPAIEVARAHLPGAGKGDHSWLILPSAKSQWPDKSLNELQARWDSPMGADAHAVMQALANDEEAATAAQNAAGGLTQKAATPVPESPQPVSYTHLTLPTNREV